MSLTDDILIHYGMPRRSGRYPWGSGDNPYQHSGDFLSRVEELKKSKSMAENLYQKSSYSDSCYCIDRSATVLCTCIYGAGTNCRVSFQHYRHHDCGRYDWLFSESLV